MNPNFQGIYAVAVTPFDSTGNFLPQAMKANLDSLISDGVHGICLLGATGEYMSVTTQEHKAIVNEIVPYIKDRVSVIVGATRERADDSIELILNAKAAGAHAAMVLTPPYCHPAQNEVVENYRYIMEQVNFPIMIYNNPGSCGIEIGKETFQELMGMKWAQIVKESSGEIRKLGEVLVDAPSDVSVFCGCDNLAFESFAEGANGWICMLANVAPKDCVALFNAVYLQKDLTKGWEIYKRILPALNALETFPKPVQALKYLATRKGLQGGYVRRPRLELTQEEKDFLVVSMHADDIS
jgi:4-hydroxy-tetrahydrodipicolinate synthase